MNRILFRLCAVIVSMAVLTSCLKDDDDEAGSAYSDTAVTYFTLGTLNRYTHTTSSTGSDSIVKTSVTGSDYRMTIDQLNHRIYNVQELPTGTDVKHVICTITTKNSGVVALQSMVSDSLQWYSAADSIDFSVPRTFRVYAGDGSGYRDYEVSLNVSGSKGTTFIWTHVGTVEMPDYLPCLEASADTVIMTRNSGIDIDWKQEQLSDAEGLLPDMSKTVIISWPYAPADDTDYMLMVGTPQQDDEPYMRVWRKIAPHAGGGQWVYMPFDDSNRYPLPRQERLAMAYYAGTVIAVGSDGIVRQSRDQGISWHTNSTYNLPSSLTGEVISMTTDGQGRMWMLTSTGQLWQGASAK